VLRFCFPVPKGQFPLTSTERLRVVALLGADWISLGVLLGLFAACGTFAVCFLLSRFTGFNIFHLLERLFGPRDLLTAITILGGPFLLGLTFAFRHNSKRLIADRFRPTIAPQVCQRCNYSLVGNTTGLCPECGTAITHASSHATPPASTPTDAAHRE
jgi:hypothetical protein